MQLTIDQLITSKLFRIWPTRLLYRSSISRLHCSDVRTNLLGCGTWAL